jgi:hypothetical protein
VGERRINAGSGRAKETRRNAGRGGGDTPEKRGAEAVVAARRDASQTRTISEERRRNRGTMEEQVLCNGNNIKETYLERENGPSPRTKTLERTGTR